MVTRPQVINPCPLLCKTPPHSQSCLQGRWRKLAALGGLGLAMAGLNEARIVTSSAQAIGFAPATIQLTINRVWGSPTVDLPPQRQLPDLYAEIDILDQSLTTPTEATPRINEAIYPEWFMSAVSELNWLERGNYIPVSIRIYDEDEGVDDKVLFSDLDFDPFACEVNVGTETIEGVWINNRSTCVISIPDLQSATGSAALTLSAQWIGVNPGR